MPQLNRPEEQPLPPPQEVWTEYFTMPTRSDDECSNNPTKSFLSFQTMSIFDAITIVMYITLSYDLSLSHNPSLYNPLSYNLSSHYSLFHILSSHNLLYNLSSSQEAPASL